MGKMSMVWVRSRNVYVLLCVLGCSIYNGIFTLARKHEPTPSMFKIDPGRLIPTMIRYGGLVLPKEVEEDLLVLNDVCRSDLTSLDIYNKELEVTNWCVTLPGHANQPSLRIGRLFLKWNSYLCPHIELEVEDVEVLVEFTNLLLTESNWSELAKMGFPPKLVFDPNAEESPNDSDQTLSSFVRIGSLDVEGNIRVKVISRALDGKEICPDFVFELNKLHDLTDRIKYASEEERRRTGRKGISTEELYNIIDEFFKHVLRKVLKSTAKDFARGAFDPKYGNSKTVEETKRAFMGAKDMIDRYTRDVTDMAEKHVQSKLVDQLTKWGLSNDQMEVVKKASKVATDTAMSSLSSAQARIEQIKKEAKEAGVKSAEEESKEEMRKWGLDEDQVEWIRAGYKAATDAAVASIDAIFHEEDLEPLTNEKSNKHSHLEALNGEVFFPPW